MHIHSEVPECNKHLENQGIEGLVQWEQPVLCLETKPYSNMYAAAQWLRHCATNQKVAGSIPNGVIDIFH
jgi:hypothetical protein